MIILRQKIYFLGKNGEVFTAVGADGKATLNNAIKNESSAVQATQAAKTRADNRQTNINIAKEHPDALKDIATRARQQGFNNGLQQINKNSSTPSTPSTTPTTTPSTPSTTPTTTPSTPAATTNSNGFMSGIKNTWNSIPKWKRTAGIMAGVLYLRNRRKRKEELEDREYRARMRGK